MMPPHLLGKLLEHFRRLQREVLLPKGLTSSGLNSRELDVLRHLADGLDTAEIAEEMRYSVRNGEDDHLQRHGPAQAAQPIARGCVRALRSGRI